MEHIKYGWVPDVPDIRDIPFTYKVMRLPKHVDLRDHYNHIYNQGSLGSCTANALAYAYDFDRVEQGLDPTLPSRLFIYYNERVMINTVNTDSGARIRDGIKTMSRDGVCEETLWPYVKARFTEKPPKPAYDDAKQSTIKEYLRLDNRDLRSLKQCLAEGHGFVFGFSVYPAFEGDEVAKTGLVPMPKPGDKLLGGHAVFAVGYDDAAGHFIVRNSWGKEWGDEGHFYIPYEYLINQNLADDFWTIRLV